MAATRKIGILIIITLLAVLLISCADPAAREEETDEDAILEESEPVEEEEITGEDVNKNDTKTGTGTSPDSGFSHTVKMDVNGEVKEGEGEGWWKDDDNGDKDEWWDED